MASTRLRASAAAVALLLAAAACGWSPEQEPPTSVGPAEETSRAPEPSQEATPPEPTPTGPMPDQESPNAGTPGQESPSATPTAPEGTGSPSPSPTSSPSPSPTATAPAPESATPSEAAAEYMDALAATDDPDRMREGWLLTPEGSTADEFLTHRISVVQARVDEGRPLLAAEVRPTAQGFELCDPGDKDADPPQERRCAHFTGFESSGERIEGFLVDGSDPGPSLLGAGEGSVASQGVHASLVSAYHAQELEVTLELSTVDAVDIDLFGAVYVGPDGQEHDVSGAAGRYELEAGATTRASFLVPDAEPGGALRIEGCLEECSATVELEVPVE